MFTLAVLIGIYSYLIFGLGLLGLLYPVYIFWLTVEFGAIVLLLIRYKFSIDPIRHIWLLSLIGILALVNLVGALGPELGFDALWYHLTIPKIWLQNHHIYFIEDARYYYSVMPKLVDILYIPALALGSEITAKLIHFGFGILTLVAVYKLSRTWLDEKYSLLACVIFYSNLVVGWQSTTAYIDLGRTFFEVLAFLLLVNKKIFQSAVVLGLAVATKLLAFGSLPIFLIILIMQKYSWKSLLLFSVIVSIVPLPWFIFSWVTTGSPVYPFLTELHIYSTRLISDVIAVFTRLPDPINPVYFMVLPLVIFYFKKLPNLITVYSLLTLLVWWIIPRTGGGRFILPYLPVWSVLATVSISNINDQTLKKLLVVLVCMVAAISLIYRGMANVKYVPVLLGWQTREAFLDIYLNMDFGDNNFYMDEPLK
jgi:4-amino-4-deoxy-L-arabinose transferase-like glycosyltransferase